MEELDSHYEKSKALSLLMEDRSTLSQGVVVGMQLLVRRYELGFLEYCPQVCFPFVMVWRGHQQGGKTSFNLPFRSLALLS